MRTTCGGVWRRWSRKSDGILLLSLLLITGERDTLYMQIYHCRLIDGMGRKDKRGNGIGLIEGAAEWRVNKQNCWLVERVRVWKRLSIICPLWFRRNIWTRTIGPEFRNCWTILEQPRRDTICKLNWLNGDYHGMAFHSDSQIAVNVNLTFISTDGSFCFHQQLYSLQSLYTYFYCDSFISSHLQQQ